MSALIGAGFAARWKRRAVTIPAMLTATALSVALLPLLAAGAAVYDVSRLRVRLPTLRVLLFVTQYLLNDSLEVLLAPLYWVLAGFGARLGSPASVRRHERLQWWSVAVMARRADHLLGLRAVLEPGTTDALGPGPVIVCCRHANVVDASLPSLLLQPRGFEVRGVIMAELLADPGFDLLYGRLGSVFIARDRGPEAQEAVARLARGMTSRSAAVIFPEGRVYRAELVQPLLDRIAARDPARAARLSGLRHVLPPRPGGVNALLDALPGADVVFIAHRGLERSPRFADLARAAPLRDAVRVLAWRCPRAEVPTTTEERTEWLDAQWERVDEWAHG